MSRGTRHPVRYTKAEFEHALTTMSKEVEGVHPKLWEYAGFELGEHLYVIPILMDGERTNMRIIIRSSLNRWGNSGGYAQNSIRAWVQYYWAKESKWCALGLESYTQRTRGWQDRLHKKLRNLYKLALEDRMRFLQSRGKRR